MFSNWSRRTKWLVSIAAAVVIVVAIVLAVVLQPKTYLGAIATDAAPCHEVGEQLLRAGGNAMDATIGILICEGVSSAQSMGLGGGFIMTIYDRVNKKAYVLNSREVAPAAATTDMFGNNTDPEDNSLYGGRAVAVPGELKGYHAAYTRFGGKLTWDKIVEPTIKICEEGVVINQYVATILEDVKSQIMRSKTLSELLVVNGEVKKKGDLIKRPKLAETLRVIAKEGPLAVHNGSLTAAFVEDLKNFNSLVTAKDLLDYEPRWTEPTVAELPEGYRLYGPPPPGSAPLLAYFLRLTAGMVKAPFRTAEQYQRVIEAMKFVFAARSDFGDMAIETDVEQKVAQVLNQTFADEVREKIKGLDKQTSTDPKFYGASWAPVDPKGTAHVAVVDSEYAISVTSTVNTEYGSKLVSPSTGIILNNQMDDFSLPGVNSYYGVPPSPANFIKPGKRPQSSMSPSVIVDKNGDVRLVIGASGGVRITSSAGLVALLHLYLGEDLDQAIAAKRFHHQLIPMAVQCERSFNQTLRMEFEKFGHATRNLTWNPSSVMAIGVDGEHYKPSADARREGVISLIAR